MFVASAVGVIVLVGVGGIAWALQSPIDNNGVIHACYNPKTGAMHLDVAGACPNKGPNTPITWSAKGPAGPPGSAGADGAFINTWKGEWNGAATYVKGDLVRFFGSSYVANGTAAPGVTGVGPVPGVDSAWEVVAAAGAPGQNGQDGASGVSGYEVVTQELSIPRRPTPTSTSRARTARCRRRLRIGRAHPLGHAAEQPQRRLVARSHLRPVDLPRRRRGLRRLHARELGTHARAARCRIGWWRRRCVRWCRCWW